MRAVVNRGPHSVAVETVPDPCLEAPLDAILRITTTNICGSDLHMYEGRTTVEEGTVLGHENMGIVEEVEYLRVPYADVNLLKLPPGTEHELDFAMLSDIFPTGYHGTGLAEVAPGDSVAVFGAGPVGLMAAHSGFLRGASRVFVVDKEPDRLALARRIEAEPIDISAGDPVEQILEATDGVGWTGASRPSATRPTTRRARSTRSWSSTTWSRWSAPPAPSAWSASTCPRTRARPTRGPERGGSAGTTGPSSPRASAWAPASAGQALQPAAAGT
jgi:threonine dehydrogenase-like Zn-dependent dehydrogenase